MFNFLFIPGLIVNNFLTFGLIKYIKVEPKVCTSISILANSVIIGSGSILYLNNYISYPSLINCFQYTLAFFVNDLWFRLRMGDTRHFQLKLIHHILATSGIYKFPIGGNLVPYLFMTEITNIPLETRNLLKYNNYNKYYLQELMILVLYISYAYFRIYCQTIFLINNFNNIYNLNSEEANFIYKTALVGIYILWTYWFLLLNTKIYQEIKKHMKYKLTNYISEYFKHTWRPITGST